MMGYISEGHKRHVWCARGVGEGATTPGSPASVTSESEGGGRRYRFSVGSTCTRRHRTVTDRQTDLLATYENRKWTSSQL